jgi:hypothetical protein
MKIVSGMGVIANSLLLFNFSSVQAAKKDVVIIAVLNVQTAR